MTPVFLNFPPRRQKGRRDHTGGFADLMRSRSRRSDFWRFGFAGVKGASDEGG
jgi:hypothetical protein